ncbi:zinc finger protein 184-like [Sitophilus oryzae]|uniref:Zinc finger protein 184-like n=1 Tax=Sitophilus oryzae TaxID=7048 RepID=A0A6J2YBU0_SITOR|nr:zinc finger protein 184-like [Sitophilus oryzae]
MELDFSKICRVCMDKGTMMSLFKVNMYKKMMACAAIQVWPNDNLPSQICNKCASKLHLCFQFKRQCEKTDVKLRQYLASLRDRKEVISIEQPNINANQPHQVDSQPINQCIYIRETNKMIDSMLPENPNYDHFMTHDQAVTQITYSNITNQQLTEQSYNIQGPIRPVSAFALNTAYTAPIHLIQQPALPVQNQIQTAQSLEQVNVSCKNINDLQSTESDDGKHCSICGKGFKTKVKLNRHMKIHNYADLPHKCKICNKGFSHSGNFKIHMRIHNNERPFKCPVCARGCRQAQDLEKHMRTHTGERPHKCHLCPKAFATSSNLIAHIRTHTGERPYVCSLCSKAFCQSNELTKHVRTHTGEKSHKCEVCKKGFNGSSSLAVHKRIHTGEKPYICNYCQRGFSSSNCLTNHVKKHQSDEVIRCIHCDLVFVNMTDLKSHLVAQHNITDIVIFEDECGNIKSKPNNNLKCGMCDKLFVEVNLYNEHLKSHDEGQES